MTNFFCYKLTDLVIRKRHTLGVDWGGPIKVLAQFGKIELWKTPGTSISRGACGKEYVSGELLLVADGDEYHRGKLDVRHEVLQEGGRLSKVKLLALAPRIDAFFGLEGLAARLDQRKTLLAWGWKGRMPR